ncbi:nuclear protein es2 [Ophiostoma piceae UAMH 11346]|uniref:Nuclear protein es2 n=1 Tax=Ophiostoma piceae (strain UAMH 11346) TaxID=1262450 RepID=S3CSM8_OPHP1|nr:nuclear protein es2 [Ophiostoma piceae UAMH 11346]
MADKDTGASSALVRKRTDTQLMPPPPVAKRIQRPKTVLDEDTYTDGLSKIIARDFFPGLLESDAQSDYLNAIDSKDQAWISSAGKRLREVMTPGNRRHRHRLHTPSLQNTDGRPDETPQSFVGDTPASVFSVSTTASAAEERASKAAAGPDTSMSLGSFQSKYTSEDNESFYKLLDKQNQKRAEKHAWLYNGNKLPSKMQLKQREIEDRLIESGTAIVDDGYNKKDRLAIKDREDRPAAPEMWKTAPKNALMFGPDGLDSSVQSVAEKAQAESLAPPKSIVYANTRLQDPSVAAEQQRRRQQLAKDRRGSSVSRASGPPSPTLSAVRDAIAGKPRRQDADSTIGSIAGSAAGTATGGETPRVNGYAFVDDDESVVDAAEAEPEPIIKFGTADSRPNPFQLQAKSTREGLHHRMVERIAHNKRTSARVGMTGRAQTPVTPYPNSPRVKGGLTPAGQRLWSSMAGGSVQRDAVSSFNKQRNGQQKDPKGSRRARLREMNAALRQ